MERCHYDPFFADPLPFSDYPSQSVQNSCIFCEIFREGKEVVFQTRHWYAILDRFPVNPGHLLLITQRHASSFIKDLSYDEHSDLFTALIESKKYLEASRNPSGKIPNGYNIGINEGKAAGQTIMHIHVHVIPRYYGDIENPRGGIRNFKEPIISY